MHSPNFKVVPCPPPAPRSKLTLPSQQDDARQHERPAEHDCDAHGSSFLITIPAKMPSQAALTPAHKKK